MTTETASVLLSDSETLTDKWEDVVSPLERGDGYKVVTHEALIDMLQEAIRSSTGKTSAGRSDDNARSIINMRAFDIYQRIQQSTLFWTTRYVRDRPNPIVKYAVATLAKQVETLWRTEQITETDYLTVSREYARWRVEIWALFNPPVVKEILAPCPQCGVQEYFNPEGERSTAITASYTQGGVVTAECRGCGAKWSGERELLELGYSIRANVDEDSLREMGLL